MLRMKILLGENCSAQVLTHNSIPSMSMEAQIIYMYYAYLKIYFMMSMLKNHNIWYVINFKVEVHPFKNIVLEFLSNAIWSI